MSIASEIQRIQSAKSAIRNAIVSKGVSVPSSSTLDLYAGYINSIQTGGSDADDIIERKLSGEYSNNRVSYIGSQIFASLPNLTSVSFENCLSIGNSAFQSCTSLSSVYLPLCQYIGDSAFRGCSGLTIASFPECIQIGSSAFNRCTSLEYAYFPLCTQLNADAFYGCTNLKSVLFSQVQTVGTRAFQGCTSLSFADFPKCTNIGQMAFISCQALQSVSFPKCITVGSQAFANCTSLSSFNASECTQIYESAFFQCPNLSYVDIPTVSLVGSYAFRSCINLSYISMSVVTAISSCAFENCSNLTNIYMPSISSIGASAFRNCYKLSSLQFSQCINIQGQAFANCSSLTEIEIGCRNIGPSAFMSCHNLNIAIIYSKANNNIQSINNDAFKWCDSLKCVYLRNTSANYEIYWSAFMNCSNLMSVYLMTSKVFSIHDANAFQNTPISTSEQFGYYGSIYVPESLYSSYIASAIWSVYSARFVSMTDQEVSYITKIAEKQPISLQTVYSGYHNIEEGDGMVQLISKTTVTAFYSDNTSEVIPYAFYIMSGWQMYSTTIYTNFKGLTSSYSIYVNPNDPL